MILEQPEWLFSVKDLTKVSKNSPSSTGGRGIAEKRKKNACSAVRSVVYYNQSKG